MRFGISDRDDYDRFSIATSSSISLLLNGLAADTDVQLISDANNNVVDSGDVLVTSAARRPTRSPARWPLVSTSCASTNSAAGPPIPSRSPPDRPALRTLHPGWIDPGRGRVL